MIALSDSKYAFNITPEFLRERNLYGGSYENWTYDVITSGIVVMAYCQTREQ